MNTAISRFNKDRLSEARQARGLTQTSLAELIGVTRQQVSLYENGSNGPSADIFESLCAVLRFPAAFFLSSQCVPEEGSAVYYRSMAAATKTARKRAEIRLQWLKEISAYVSGYLQLPSPDFPVFDIPENPLGLSNTDIEKLASDTRRYWGLGDGYISDLILLLEKKGAVVTRGDLYVNSLDALSAWSDEHDRPYIYLSCGKDSAVRSRFDVAHELAHLVLHRNLDPKLLENKATFNEIERQAHRFAGAFLLPAETFCSHLLSPTLNGFLSVKATANVSIAMMIMRCEHLGIIDEFQKKKLFINYSRRGWKKGEPLDNQIQPESPRIIGKSIKFLVEQSVVTKADVKQALPYASTDICELACLDKDFLDIEECVVTDFPEIKVKTESEGTAGADILPFKK